MLPHLTHFSVSSLNLLDVAYDYHAFLIDKSFLLVVVPEVSNSFRKKHTGFPVTFAKLKKKVAKLKKRITEHIQLKNE